MHALGIELWVMSMESPHRFDGIATSDDNEPSAEVFFPDSKEELVQGIRCGRA
jgi:hypothetical protein